MLTPVSITTPDGVERFLRFTLGARKRIQMAFGKPCDEALKGMSDEDLPTKSDTIRARTPKISTTSESDPMSHGPV